MRSFLLDASAWARSSQPTVGARLEQVIASGSLVVCAPTVIEALRSSRARDVPAMRAALTGFPSVRIHDATFARSIEVVELLAAVGHHVAPSVPDLLVAAAAEANDLTVLHYDKDFDLIAGVTGQQMEWVVPAGTAN